MDGFKVYDITAETIPLFQRCFDLNGSPKKIENIRWQFLNNTMGSSCVDILFDEDKQRTASIYAIACVKFKIDNYVKIGAQSLDTLTDIEYRGLGLFIKSAKDVYIKAKNKNVELVYGFPNGSSMPGFKKLLQWKVLDPLPFLIKPLRSKYFTRRIKALRFLPDISLSFINYKSNRNFILKEDNTFPPEVNELWEKFALNIKVGVIRDQEYLSWRYLEKPNENYKVMHCYSVDGIYLGYIVYAVKEKHEGKIGYIMELIYDTDQPNAGNILLKYAISQIKQQNADCILSWCLEHSPNYGVFKKQMFLKMPEKIRPIELHFGVRTLNDDLSTIIENRFNWYISYSDSDTV